MTYLDDLRQTNNLYNEHRDIAERLQQTLERIREAETP